jgi:glycolate dehydrogenase iron-sulfur subunit
MNSGQNNELLNVLPDDDVLSQCIHCGLCLSVCPTYEITKLERSSPRGRIKLIKSIARGEMLLTETFSYEMNFCLDCQACETACPAGVKYGSMVEAARVEVDNSQFGNSGKNKIKKFILNNIFISKKRFKFIARLLYFYQKSGIQKFLHTSGLFKVLTPRLSEIDKLSPTISTKFSDEIIPEYSLPKGEIKYRVAFLSGCLMNVMFAEINKDTVDVLTECGCSVITPKEQICCGSLNAHNGQIESAKKLAKHTIDTFQYSQSPTMNNQPPTTDRHFYDYLVTNSAGCSAFMKEYAHLLEDDPDYSEKAKIFSSKVKDFSEFFSELHIHLPLNEISESITYHDACHLAHTQKIVTQPRELLKSIPNVNYTELEESNWCCGSAGIYNLMQYETSMTILKRKIDNIKKTDAKIVVTGNPGCISQLKYGAKKFNIDVEVLHPATLIKKILIKS